MEKEINEKNRKIERENTKLKKSKKMKTKYFFDISYKKMKKIEENENI